MKIQQGACLPKEAIRPTTTKYLYTEKKQYLSKITQAVLIVEMLQSGKVPYPHLLGLFDISTKQKGDKTQPKKQKD